MEWLSELTMCLEIPLNFAKKWKYDYNLDKLTEIEIYVDLLTQWRMIKSNDATLGALYKAIPNDKKQLKGCKSFF